MKSKRLRQRLRYSALAVAAFGASGPSYAQDAPETAVTAVNAEENDEPTNQGEIIVTAQRREERLVDVPISITALDRDILERSGVTTSKDLEMVTPGLRMDQTGAYVQPAIRGVTTTITGSTDANIATYVDGVYQPTTLQAVFNLRDVSAIEVLKGPQGTLFGRNATGGAILIRTLSPHLYDVTGEVAAGYGSFDTTSASAFVSVPLIEGTAAFSLSGAYENMAEGYIRNLAKGGMTGKMKSQLLRGKLRFAWAGADFLLTGLYSKLDDQTAYSRTNYQGNNSRAAQAAAAGVPLATRPHEYSGDQDADATTEVKALSLSGDIELGRGTLTLRSSYLTNDTTNALDTDGTPLPLQVTVQNSAVENFSQEVIYATEQLGRVRAIGGLFYYYKNTGQLPVNVNNFQQSVWVIEKVQAYAAFGELTFDLSDRLSLTAGARYSYETYYGFVAAQAGIRTRPPIRPFGNDSWESIDPRVSLLYSITDDANVYATYSQGFKSGLINTASRQPDPVRPETIDAFEVGFKGSFGRALFINAAGFHYKYKDLHQSVRIPINNVPTNRVQNAAQVDIWGLELSGSLRVLKGLSFNFGGQYLDATYTRFPNALVTVPITSSNIVQMSLDVSGRRVVRSPELSGTLTAQYSQDTSVGRFDASATLQASSRVYYDPANRVFDEPHARLNASLSYQPAAVPGLQVKLWGKNLTNIDTIGVAQFSTSYDAITYEPPRSFGAELSFEF